ncbi:MAG TPA: hypothetical protein VH988_15695 [Thermoanaerobaculia bacterium]|jgi:hypothetical protein|nr:hypothetical protein [Thermoanaerobaculia bacterium]
MNPNDDSRETELRRLFAERERRDEAASPSYERVVHRPARARQGRRRLALAACAAGVLLLTLLAVWRERPGVAPEPALSTWKAPTDFLLAVPGNELLNSTPSFPDLRRL